MTSRLEIDAERMMADARELAFPRYPGTAGDRRAIAWVEKRFRQCGLDVSAQPFSYDLRPALAALRGLLIGCAALVGAAGLAATCCPGAAGGLLALALAAAAVFLAWAPGLERLYRRPGPVETANVEGRRRASGERRATVIFLAHHDSKSQSLSLPWRAGLTLTALGGALGLGGVLASRLICGAEPAGPEAVVLGGAAAAALLALSTLRSGNASPGGVDNAGSVAVVIELARRLSGRIDPAVELIFLSPGAEEDHMVGAMRWLDAHREELASGPAWAINLDGAGIPGRLALLERYGWGRLFSPLLSRVARRAAAALGLRVRGVFLPPALGVDAIPFAHRGVDCLTLASGGLNRAVLAVHTAGDVAEHLDPEALAAAARLAVAIVDRLAERVPGDARRTRPGPPTTT